MPFLEIVREPAGGIGEDLHPPDDGVLKQAFGKKGIPTASGVFGKKVEALSDEAQQLMVGAQSTRASRNRRLRVRTSCTPA